MLEGSSKTLPEEVVEEQLKLANRGHNYRQRLHQLFIGSLYEFDTIIGG